MRSKKMLSALETLKELNNLFQNHLLIKAENTPIKKIESIEPEIVKLLHKAGIKTVSQLINKNIDDVVSIGIKKTKAKKIMGNLKRLLDFKPKKITDKAELSLKVKEFNNNNPKIKKYTKHMVQTINKMEFKKAILTRDFLSLCNLSILIVNDYFHIQDIVSLKNEELERFTKVVNVNPVLMKAFISSLVAKICSIKKPPNRMSKIQIYNKLLNRGYRTGADIIKQNPIKLVMDTGVCHNVISGMINSILSGTKQIGLYEVLNINTKGFTKPPCCPPYEALMWREKYDYFTEDSALHKLMNSIKDNVSATTKQIISQQSHLFPLLEKYELYDISEPIGNNVDINKDIKYLKEASDDVLTEDVVNAVLDNLRKELLAIQSKMRVSRVWAVINTYDPFGPYGGAEEDKVHLDIIDSANNKHSIKPIHGSYDDGQTAIFGYPADTIPMLNIFTPNGDLNLRKIRLDYSQGEEWYFDSMYVKFIYDDQSSRILDLINPDQIPYNWEELQFYSWDTVLDDNERGWVDYTCFEYRLARGIYVGTTCGNPFEAPDSDFNRVYEQIRSINGFLNTISNKIQEASAENIFQREYNNINTLLNDAATNFLRQEYAIARDKYNDILEFVNVLISKANLLPFEKEFLFAIYVLIADTHLEEGNYGFAYSYYNTAYKYLTYENNSYLWLKVANLFVKWGDCLYAQAGSNYEKRLFASIKYQKVANSDIILSHKDGCEDEVKELWIDLGTIENQSNDSIKNWLSSLKIHVCENTYPFPILYTSLPAIDPLPIKKIELLTNNGSATARPAFVRLTIDVSEREITREFLRFVISNIESNLAIWKPSWIRFHIGYEHYNPLAVEDRENNGYFGLENNILTVYRDMGEPVQGLVTPGDLCIWVHQIYELPFIIRLLKPGDSCEYNYFIEYAKLRLDQIANHLNFLMIHDEYVPAHRFQELYRSAVNLANRADGFQQRYFEFKTRAENETLSLMEADYISETAQINLDISRERLNQSIINSAAAFSQLLASQSVVGQSRDALILFDNTYQDGFERFLNSVSISFPPALGTIGTSITGAGYEEMFALQRHQYESEVARAEAAVQQAEFYSSIAELELLISEKFVELDAAKLEFAKDRIKFMQNKEMNASFWYLMASLYKDLVNSLIQSATHLAWMAERALEFEINHSVNIIRLDYFQLEAGAALLLKDIGQLNHRLFEFRERYRDIPNIIEREFYFSRDFHEQFRILTSSEPSPDMIQVPEGLRRVEFTTPMIMYDKKIPGRYAFGRILGVEVEIQGDVGEGMITGYLENAKFVETQVEGETKLIRRSTSLVRVPEPIPDERFEICEPVELLKSDFPKEEDDKFPFRPDIIDENLLPLEREPGKSMLKNLSNLFGADFEDDNKYNFAFNLFVNQNPKIENIFDYLDDITNFVLINSGIQKEIFLYKGLEPDPVDHETKMLIEKADEAGIGINELKNISQLVGPSFDESMNAVNTYFRSRNIPLVVDNQDISSLKKIKKIQIGFTEEDFKSTLDKIILDGSSKSWKRFRYGWNPDNSTIIYKDLTRRYSAYPLRFDYVSDYVDYKDLSPKYVLRIKSHDADRLSLSTYNRKEDAIIFNPYNSQDLLGVFENTGIHTDWNLTLIAQTNDKSEPRFVYDKIREIIMRVWYHAANERDEGPTFADFVEKSVMKLKNLTSYISFYRDFYDEFITLVGDYPDDEPSAISAIRKFTDISHPSNRPNLDGWIEFSIDEKLIPFDDRRIRSIFLVFNSTDPDQMPDYEWYLRKDINGPSFKGNSRGENLGELVTTMSQTPPDGFAGINPRGVWYFRLAQNDNNVGKSLEFIKDIELIIEYSVS